MIIICVELTNWWAQTEISEGSVTDDAVTSSLAPVHLCVSAVGYVCVCVCVGAGYKCRMNRNLDRL